MRYSPWDDKELDTTEPLSTHTHTHTHTHTFTEENPHLSGQFKPVLFKGQLCI